MRTRAQERRWKRTRRSLPGRANCASCGDHPDRAPLLVRESNRNGQTKIDNSENGTLDSRDICKLQYYTVPDQTAGTGLVVIRRGIR